MIDAIYLLRTLTRLQNRRLHLGVSGSIACYKAADLLRHLLSAKINVSATLTSGAQHFVKPLLFSSLGASPVYPEMFTGEETFAHLEPGQSCHALLVAPASANLIARMAAGLAQDMNRLARAVQQRVDQLENTAESQKTFTANMAHEMKTPLTSILGFADLLQLQKQVPDEQRMRYAGIIVEETRRLRSLSGTLMELLAVENRNLVLTPVDMPGLFKEVATAIQPLLAGGRLRLEEYCQPMVVNGDRELLKSLLYNFLDNARKASPAGSRLVLAGRPQNGWAEICIRDYGRGIPAAELDKIRQPFYMVDKSRARKAGGAGLGLALCEQIVRIHGGRYEVDSRVGQGTLITLYLPLAGREERKETDHEA